MEYDYIKTLDVKYFKEIFENSLSFSDTSYFCKYFFVFLITGLSSIKRK